MKRFRWFARWLISAGFGSVRREASHRYFAPHREVPNLKFAGPDAPIALGNAQRLSLDDNAHQLGAELLIGWYTSAPRDGEEIAWAPDGRSFLVSTATGLWGWPGSPSLLSVRTDGGSVTQIAAEAQDYSISSDGGWIAFLRYRPGQIAPRWDVVTVDRHGQRAQVLGQTNIRARPAIVRDSVWFLDGGGVRNIPLASDGAAKLIALPSIDERNGGFGMGFGIAGDGERLGYGCGDALCLANLDGDAYARVDLGAPPRLPTPTPTPSSLPTPPPTLPPASKPQGGNVPQRPAFAQLQLAWSASADRLAAVVTDYGENAMPTLWIVDNGGKVLLRTVIGPNGLSRAPQWTPDGKWIFLNTFPEAGRRILAIDANSGQVYDLSQPRWDTFFSLAPDGKRLLLWNGRGGFWMAAVEMRYHVLIDAGKVTP